MSALTDIFLQLSNQIRKYLGTTTKYTPAQAILAIDEVYAAGGGGVTPKGNAGVGDVLSGKTFSSSAGTNLTGEMPNNTAYTSYLNCGDTYTIPQGYHSGTGKVIVNSLSSQTVEAPAIAATAERIINGYRAWVNGKEIVGSMPVNEDNEISLNCDDTYYIPAGYHTGSGRVVGTSLADQTKPASGYGAATSSEIASGYQAWVNGVRVTGSMTNHGSSIIYNDLLLLPTGVQEGIVSAPIPQGYYDEESAVYTHWQNKTVTAVLGKQFDVTGDNITSATSYTRYHYLLGKVTVKSPLVEEGEGTATTSNKTFYPITSAFTSFTVKPTPSYQGSGTADTSDRTVTPTSGNYFSSFVISPTPTESGSADSLFVSKTYYPSIGKYFSSFTVNAMAYSTGSATALTTAKTYYPSGGGYVSFTVNPQQHSGTYSATSRGASLDMGAVHNYRYVNTNSVPNTNSATYTYSSGKGGTVDLGVTNTYRYVNATNVYNKGYDTGYDDGVVSATFTGASGHSGADAAAKITHTCSEAGLYVIIEYASTTKMASPATISCTGSAGVGNKYALNGSATGASFVYVTEVYNCKKNNVITIAAKTNRTHVRIIKCN